MSRPNVLLLYTDQQRWDSLGCYGNKLAITPNLDKLAAMGAKLEHCYVQNPVCMPSRMSFLTGRYCGSLGVGVNGIPLPDDAVPVNRLLKPYGYHTAQIGKLHFQPHAKRNHRNPHPDYGFDTFILSDEPGCYDDAYTKWVEWTASEALAHIRTSLPDAAVKYGQTVYSDKPRNVHQPYLFQAGEHLTHSSFVAEEICGYIEKHKNGPFFAIAGFYAPHCPLNPPKRFVDLFHPDELPLPVTGGEEGTVPLLKDVSPNQWREIIAYYMALVSHVDDCIGKIIRTLEREGLLDNTLIVFTSDHGEYLGDHGRIQKGMPGHDCITRVPCIISYPPKIEAGAPINGLAEAVDIVPTILDYCGVQTPPFIQGKSLKPVLEGLAEEHREDVLTEFFVPGGIRQTTVRTKEYKYYCDSEGKEILYDLLQDPFELHNAEGEERYETVLSEMRKRMIVRLQTAGMSSRERTAEY